MFNCIFLSIVSSHDNDEAIVGVHSVTNEFWCLLNNSLDVITSHSNSEDLFTDYDDNVAIESSGDVECEGGPLWYDLIRDVYSLFNYSWWLLLIAFFIHLFAKCMIMFEISYLSNSVFVWELCIFKFSMRVIRGNVIFLNL